MAGNSHGAATAAERLLVFAPRAPAFDRSSGGLRFYTMLRILSRSFAITFVPTSVAFREVLPGVNRYSDALRELGIDVYIGDIPFHHLVTGTGWIAAFFEFYLSALTRYFDVIRFFAPALPVIIDSVDLHYVRELRMAQYEPNLKTVKEATETKRQEQGIYRNADLVITVTESDREVLLKDLPGLRIAVVPNIHQTLRQSSPREERIPFTILFVGGFAHRPNVDAVVFFCREILPLVRRQIPHVSVTIVGDAPPPEVTALAPASRVTVTGYVEDLSSYLRSAWVSIAPLRYGSGMKGKITESLAAGLPVVTTTVGAEGLDLRNRSTAMIADTPGDFARAVVELCVNDQLHKELSENGLSHIGQRCDISMIERRLLETISCVQKVRTKAASPANQLKLFGKMAGHAMRGVLGHFACYCRGIGIQ